MNVKFDIFVAVAALVIVIVVGVDVVVAFVTLGGSVVVDVLK